MKTTFSKILEINGSFWIWELFWSLGSRFGFLKNGCIAAFFKADGSTPCVRQLFIIAKMKALMVSKTSTKRQDGEMSEGQEVGFMLDHIRQLGG